MADGGNGNPTRKDGGVATANTTIQVVITFDQVTSAVNVQGPVGNLLLMYGILEAAKDSCREYVKQQNSGARIVPANSIPGLKM